MIPNAPTEDEHHFQATFRSFQTSLGHFQTSLGHFQVTLKSEYFILTGSSVGSIHEYQSIRGDMKSGKECQWKED